MVKSRQRKLDERWGSESSAKGTRFKLNRDLAGFHETRRNAIEVEEEERGITLRIEDPPELRSAGTLVSLEDVAFGYVKGKAVLSGVTFGIEPGSRIGLGGAVSSLDPESEEGLLMKVKNGQGKTSLARLIVGELKSSAGSIMSHPHMRARWYHI